MYYKLALLLLVTLIHGSAYAESVYSISSGAKVFKKCQNCHQIGDGAKNRVGPQLNNIFGRTAGGSWSAIVPPHGVRFLRLSNCH